MVAALLTTTKTFVTAGLIRVESFQPIALQLVFVIIELKTRADLFIVKAFTSL